MNKTLTKIIAIIVGLSISALVYFSLWYVFKYYGIVN
jgi:hypothetical protein